MSVEDSVRQMLRDFMRAFERGDLDMLNRMFVHDAALLFYGTHDKLHYTGWPAVEQSFKLQSTFLKDLECRITDDIHVRLLAGGAAACAGTAGLAMHGMMGDVRFDVTSLRMTCTMERDGDRWQFVQMHLSAPDRPFVEKVAHVIEEHLDISC